MGLKLTTAEVTGKNIAPKIAAKMKGKRPVSRTTPRKEMTADQWFLISTLQIVGEVLKVTASAGATIRDRYELPAMVDKELLKRALTLVNDPTSLAKMFPAA
jgi:hypothetical protein